jgi:hypothetical protein
MQAVWSVPLFGESLTGPYTCLADRIRPAHALRTEVFVEEPHCSQP